jgi:hypothetical protein
MFRYWHASATLNRSEVAPLEITTGELDNGVRDESYSEAVVATGGVEPYTWSIIVGALPIGLSLNAASGAITGTPTVIEVQEFTIQVEDDAAETDTQVLSIDISGPP